MGKKRKKKIKGKREGRGRKKLVGDRHTHLINTPPKYYGPGQGRTGRTIDTSPVPPLPHPQFKTSMLCINVYHHTQLLL